MIWWITTQATMLAPMFLVTNELMLQNAMKSGVMGVFPSLNYRDEGQLGQVLDGLNAFKKDTPGNYGVNLIVQKANPFYEKHLAICIEKEVPFFITSLGNPKEVIEKAHAYGGKVFCDVVNLEHAKKCASYNCDGFIAVGQGAGGHAGNNSLQVLIPALVKEFPNIPVVGAGGISSGAGLLSIQALGAIGASIGTRFIASEEASVSKDYKNAIVKSGMKDIVLTERLSGTPCTIIETPYSKKIGYKQNWFERLMNKNKKVRKYYKMLVQSKGMKKLEKSVKPGNYNNLWCAGQSVELISDVKSIDNIVQTIMKEHSEARKNLLDF